MSPTRPPRRRAVSAGGVVYRHGIAGVEVVLVGRAGERLWALPKGTPEPGESLEETARREVREETGLCVEIARPIGQIHYSYMVPDPGFRVVKVVHHYLMTARGGDLEDHDHEYDIAAWVGAPDALRRLTYDNERDMLRLALELVPLERGREGCSQEAAG